MPYVMNEEFCVPERVERVTATTMEGTSTVQQSDCARCSTQAWRPDWDFLKEFFRREQALQQEMQTLVTQHTFDY